MATRGRPPKYEHPQTIDASGADSRSGVEGQTPIGMSESESAVQLPLCK